jgi:hypothetical protein
MLLKVTLNSITLTIFIYFVLYNSSYKWYYTRYSLDTWYICTMTTETAITRLSVLCLLSFCLCNPQIISLSMHSWSDFIDANIIQRKIKVTGSYRIRKMPKDKTYLYLEHLYLYYILMWDLIYSSFFFFFFFFFFSISWYICTMTTETAITDCRWSVCYRFVSVIHK